ncbi:hypothetical protein IKI14_06000 [bacterium]|nr:hypothetical protein [bacterium]
MESDLLESDFSSFLLFLSSLFFILDSEEVSFSSSKLFGDVFHLQEYPFKFQFAVYDLSPVLHHIIVMDMVGVAMSTFVHQINECLALVGAFRLMLLLSIVYVDGFSGSLIQPFNS